MFFFLLLTGGYSSKSLPYSVIAQIFFPLTMTILEGDACSELVRGSCPIIQGGIPFTFKRNFKINPGFRTFPQLVIKLNL